MCSRTGVGNAFTPCLVQFGNRQVLVNGSQRPGVWSHNVREGARRPEAEPDSEGAQYGLLVLSQQHLRSKTRASAVNATRCSCQTSLRRPDAYLCSRLEIRVW